MRTVAPGHSIRRMGDGYEPHVDEADGRLVYSLPVDSGLASVAFAYEIRRGDLDVLLRDPHRRAALETVAHTVLQRAMTRGGATVAQTDFAALVECVLHSAPEELSRWLATFDREHAIRTDVFIRQAMARWRAGGP